MPGSEVVTMPHPVIQTSSMIAVDERSDEVYEQFKEMCFDLNMDKLSEREAWNSYCQVKQNYSLEGNRLHWLACALYVACRKSSVPAVAEQTAPMQGNFISLTRLLRFSRFSLLEFFDKSKKWAEMSNLPHPFQRNLDALERNFAVSTFLFNKYYEPMFKIIYTDPADDPPRLPKPRKQRRGACTAGELFQFTWSLFVLVKSSIPSVSADLVSTYHLLLAGVDFIYGVTVAADRRDLLNSSFPALPDNFDSRDYAPPAEVPSALEYLCKQFDGLIVEAKSIRQHVWKEKMEEMFEAKTLQGDEETLGGILDVDVFEPNWKTVNKRYEEYLLTCGNFDERTFLGEQAGLEIGTPSKANNFTVTAGDLAERIHVRRNIMLNQSQNSVLMPSTPLTGRGFLRADSAQPPPAATPIAASMYSVSRLQALLEGRGPQPSPQLAAVLSSCSPDPTEQIAGRVSEFAAELRAAAVAPEQAHDLVERRFHLAAAFYYKMLENVVISERRRKPEVNLLVLLDQSVFHWCLLACSLEIVLFSYNTAPLEFPWLLETLHIEPYDFYKLLEIIIREEQGLCRDVVKHLNKVEELVLDSMAWRRSSRLWGVIEAAPAGGIPTSETVAPHLQEAPERSTPQAGLTPGSVSSPAHHNPTVRRLFITYSSRASAHNPQQSPVSSATERFTSPVVPSSARRRLFVTGPRPSARDLNSQAKSASPVLERRFRRIEPATPTAGLRTYSLLMDSGSAPRPTAESPSAAPAPTETAAPAADQSAAPDTTTTAAAAAGESAAADAGAGAAEDDAPGTDVAPSADTAGTADTAAVAGEAPAPALSTPGKAPSAETQPPKPKQNSLSLFFRKFYYLASVRIRDLCERLRLPEEARETIWTVFEYVVVHHVTIMQGRHLDQLIMSSIFVVCKAFGINKKFTDIMGMYRCQPQAKSHVYRSVLLGSSQKPAAPEGEENRPVAEPAASADAAVEQQKPAVATADAAAQPPVKATPAACLPTPSRMAGTATSYQFEDRHEERGDIIQFYNQIFVEKVKAFVSRFSWAINKPPLSPLPSPRLSPLPLSRKVSSKHSIYISPLKQSPSRFGDRTSVRSYSFNRSPAHELRSINAMVRPRGGERGSPAGDAAVKRPRPPLEPAEVAPEAEPKRYKARLRDVLDQRQANLGE